jgi:hypothetical protein
MSFYVFGQIKSWLFNVTYIAALVVIIRLAIKVTEAVDIYINDKKNSKDSFQNVLILSNNCNIIRHSDS